MTETERKLKDALVRLKEENKRLKAQLVEERSPHWIAAIHTGNDGGDRLIINLAAMTQDTKDKIKVSIDNNSHWFSLDNRGDMCVFDRHNCGLHNYDWAGLTKIVFGGDIL
jgi:hypothetical protein